jgi:hypothetical protein
VATHVVILYLSLKFALLREQKRLLLGFVLVSFLSWRGDKCVGLCMCVCVCFLAAGCHLVGCVCERERERERERAGHWGRGGGRGLFYILKQASLRVWGVREKRPEERGLEYYYYG